MCKNRKPCLKTVTKVCPFTSTAKESTEQVCATILHNQQVTINEVAHNLCISHSSAQGNTKGLLRFHKFCARWVMNQLTGESKCNRLTICQGLLNHYCNEEDAQSLEMSHGFTIKFQKANAGVWNGNFQHRQCCNCSGST
jgi:hypothetical protein